MPRGSRFKQPADNSVFGKAISASIEDASKLLNAIDFIESPQGLNIRLYPLQRLVVKCLFAVPLDYKPITIPLWDVFRENLLREVSEEECLHIFKEEGRCNVGDWRDIPERGFNEAVIFAGRRAGKMLHVDELIPTPHGYVRNGDLKEGDSIFGEDGKIYQVKYAHPIQEEDAFKVSFDDGTFTYAHAGHLWHTYTRKERKNRNRRKTRIRPIVEKGFCQCGCGGNQPVSKLSNLKKGVNKGDFLPFIQGHHLRHLPSKYASNKIVGSNRTTEEILHTLRVCSNKSKAPQANHSIKLSSPVILPEKNLPIDPYAFGLWLGDGSADAPSLTSKDKESIEVWYNLAKSYSLHINVRPKDNTDCCTYFITSGQKLKDSNPFLTALRSLGVLNNKHIPHDYLWSSYEQRLALLQGLIDSDGYVAKDGNVIFTNTNRNLSEGVYFLASSLGIKPYWSETRATLYGKDCGANYEVSWTSTFVCCRLPRKVNLLPKVTKDTQNWRYIVDIEPVGKMQMRCVTTTNPSGLYLFGKNFNVTHNSQVVSAIGAYKLYLLLNVKSPQDYFDLVPGSPIDFTFLAQDEDGSKRLYEKLREDINRAPFFNPYLKVGSGAQLGFVSDYDRLKRDTTPTINVRSLPCTTNSSRGPSNLFLALDEFAHFRSAKGSASDEVYAAATPSTINFKHAELLDGGWVSQKATESLDYTKYKMFQDSLILSISSPWTKVGKMYDLHKQALDKGPSSGMFTIRVSTAEMNPTILSQTLRKEHDKNPLTFKAEYGGLFLESSESYVTEVQIRNCTDVRYVKGESGIEEPDLSTARFNTTRFHPSAIGRQYFWAIDLGMSNDATAVAIGHLEYKGGSQPIHLIYDYIDRMMVGEKFEGIGALGVQSVPGIEKYVGYKALPLEDILSWLKALNNVMPCYRGATDQHGGQQLVQLLELNKIYNMELVNLSSTINSQMAYVLQGYIRDGRCRFPYTPKFLNELRLVEAEFVSKYQIRVSAPLEKGSHDDMVDAAQLCAFKAQKWLIEEGGLSLDPSGQSLMISAQLNQPSGVIASMDGIMLRDLQILERMKKMQQNAGISGMEVVRNPFHRRGR